MQKIMYNVKGIWMEYGYRYAMKSHEGSGGIAPCSLNLSTGRRSVVSLRSSTHWIGRCMSCSTGFGHWRKRYYSLYNIPWRHKWKGDGELRYRSTFSLTSVPDGCEWSVPCPVCFTWGKYLKPIVSMAGCASGPVWTGVFWRSENFV